jgi:hypothetical protein
MPKNNKRNNSNSNKSSSRNNSKLLKSNSLIEILMMVLIIIVIILIIENKNNKNTKDQFKNSNSKDNSLSFFQYQKSKAFERVINPLLPPERSYENTYGIPINIPSRGDVGSFQQVGALYKESIESENQKSGNNNDSVVLALYGKKTYPSSRNWSYYTSSADSHHQVKMPITHKGKKCDSQYGCEEIMNDDLITIPGYNGIFRAVIYDFDVPKYLPCV